MVKLPIGDDGDGASTGKTDFIVDGIVSAYGPMRVEFSGYGGFMVRGNPDGYELTNGLRWGFGAASRSATAGFRFTAELFGEKYFDDAITAPAGLTRRGRIARPARPHTSRARRSRRSA